MLKMAEVIMLRTDKEPTPEQLAKKASFYATAMHNEMLSGLTALDMEAETRGHPIAQPAFREPPREAIPVLEPTGTPNVSCPECGAPMRKRWSKSGGFFGCSSYPTCRGTRNI